MAQQDIDVGSFAGDGTGDPLREAFTKINENFTELYSGNVQVTASNVLVYSVAGRIGNVVLTVNDVAQAASKSYVDNAISANLDVTGTITNSLNANITAANTVISNHAARITTLESNATTQATQINNLVSVKADVSYVDTSIDLALSSNAILANVQAVNANVTAANAAILLRANLSGANFTGNITANSISASNYIRTESYFLGGNEYSQPLVQDWANPAALFFGNSATNFSPETGSRYYQINLQNRDSLGSGDVVVTADNGTDGSNFISFGISGSQYYEPYYPSQSPLDGYVYIIGGNLDLQSEYGNIELIAGNLVSGQVILTTSNILKLTSNLVIEFPDGTIQSTAFGGNANIASINANVTAANAAITSLQANAASQSLDIDNLLSNAAGQASSIIALTANAAVQATALNILNANVSEYQTFANSNASSQATSLDLLNANVTAANLNIATLLANAVTQSLSIDNLQSNAQSQQASIIVLQSNSSAQAIQIDLLDSNLAAANINIAVLTSNAASQATQINLLNANVTAANLIITALQSNSASQALDIDNLYANVNFYLANVATSNANIEAANARIIILDANLGSTHTNVSSLQSNALAQENRITLLNANVAAANIDISTKANINGDIFNGNIQANYILANSNVKVTSTIEVGTASPINYPGLGGVFVGNVNGYYQVVVQNLSTASNASSDFVLTADDGTDENYYITISMNNSGWSGNFIVPAGDTGLIEWAHDGYITTIGGNSALRSDNDVYLVANTAVVGLLKDSNFALLSSNLEFSDGSVQSTAYSDSNLGSVTGNIVPSANLTYTLGNVDFQWKEIHVGGNTIYMGGVPISASYIDEAGSLTLGANSYIQFTSFADVPENTMHDVVAIRAGYDGVEGSNFVFASNGAMIVSPDFRILPRDGLSSGDPESASGNITIGNLIALSSVIGDVSYTPNNVANYNGTITNIRQALDELAARLKALGG